MRVDGPFDLARWSARFTRWGVDPANVVDGEWYYRVAVEEAGAVPYRVRDGPEVESSRPDAADADFARRIAADLPWRPVQQLAEDDPVVARLVGRHLGVRPPITPDPFEALVRSICAQQVNLRWATTVWARIVTGFGRPHDFDGVVVWEPPRASDLASVDPAALTELQLTRNKARAVVEAAEAVTHGRLDGLGDLDESSIVERLTSLYGVGRWTAEWYLARTLASLRAVAAGDLGVRRAVGRIYMGLDRSATEDEVRHVADGWGDGANWVAHLLLEELAGSPGA